MGLKSERGKHKWITTLWEAEEGIQISKYQSEANLLKPIFKQAACFFRTAELAALTTEEARGLSV